MHATDCPCYACASSRRARQLDALYALFAPQRAYSLRGCPSGHRASCTCATCGSARARWPEKLRSAWGTRNNATAARKAPCRCALCVSYIPGPATGRVSFVPAARQAGKRGHVAATIEHLAQWFPEGSLLEHHCDIATLTDTYTITATRETSTIMARTINMKISDARNDIARLQRQVDMETAHLETLIRERDHAEPGDGATIRFTVQHDEGGTRYGYAALRVGTRWFTTGSTCPKSGHTWGQLLDLIGSGTSSLAYTVLVPQEQPF